MLQTAQAMQTALVVALQTAIVMVVTVQAVQTQLRFTMAHLMEMSAMMMAGILWETPQATEMMRQLSLISLDRCMRSSMEQATECSLTLSIT